MTSSDGPLTGRQGGPQAEDGTGGMHYERHRPRFHSHPEVPDLIPLPLRPHSSYHRPPVLDEKEEPQFPIEVVQAMSKLLSIDPSMETELLWIIRDCLLALQNEGWLLRLQERDAVFVNDHTGVVQSTLPTLEEYRLLAHRIAIEKAELDRRRTNRLFRAQEIIFDAVERATSYGGGGARAVAQARTIESLLPLLDVSPLYEPYLLPRVKAAIEQAYFRKRDDPETVTLYNCVDPQKLFVHLELDRIGFLKKISPTGLLICVECESALADFSCAVCHDTLCNFCFFATHLQGRRRDHPAVFMEQFVCSECQGNAAVVRCEDCADLFCLPCFEQTHRKGKRQQHGVILASKMHCFQCDEKESAYICEDCGDALCPTCSRQIHRKGARQNHKQYGVKKTLYTPKLFAKNLDTVLKVWHQSIQHSYPLSPWLKFYEGGLVPYWYNFKTREKVFGEECPAPPEEDLQDILSSLPAQHAATGTRFVVPGMQRTTSTHHDVPASRQLQIPSMGVVERPPPTPPQLAPDVALTLDSKLASSNNRTKVTEPIVGAPPPSMLPDDDEADGKGHTATSAAPDGVQHAPASQQGQQPTSEEGLVLESLRSPRILKYLPPSLPPLDLPLQSQIIRQLEKHLRDKENLLRRAERHRRVRERQGRDSSTSPRDSDRTVSPPRTSPERPRVAEAKPRSPTSPSRARRTVVRTTMESPTSVPASSRDRESAQPMVVSTLDVGFQRASPRTVAARDTAREAYQGQQEEARARLLFSFRPRFEATRRNVGRVWPLPSDDVEAMALLRLPTVIEYCAMQKDDGTGLYCSLGITVDIPTLERVRTCLARDTPSSCSRVTEKARRAEPRPRSHDGGEEDGLDVVSSVEDEERDEPQIDIDWAPLRGPSNLSLSVSLPRLEEQRRQESAVTIQRSYRGFKGRQRVARLRGQKEMFAKSLPLLTTELIDPTAPEQTLRELQPRQQQAAKDIQRTFRGYEVRKVLSPRPLSSTSPPLDATLTAPAPPQAEEATELLREALVDDQPPEESQVHEAAPPQVDAADETARPAADGREASAAVTIQKVWRGRQCRRDMSARQPQEAAHKTAGDSVAPGAAARAYVSDLTKSLSTVSAMHTAEQGRDTYYAVGPIHQADTLFLEAEVDTLDDTRRKADQQPEQKAPEEAAVPEAADTDKGEPLQEEDHAADELRQRQADDAAVKIQAAWKGKKTRQELETARRIREAVKDVFPVPSNAAYRPAAAAAADDVTVTGGKARPKGRLAPVEKAPSHPRPPKRTRESGGRPQKSPKHHGESSKAAHLRDKKGDEEGDQQTLCVLDQYTVSHHVHVYHTGRRQPHPHPLPPPIPVPPPVEELPKKPKKPRPPRQLCLPKRGPPNALESRLLKSPLVGSIKRGDAVNVLRSPRLLGGDENDYSYDNDHQVHATESYTSVLEGRSTQQPVYVHQHLHHDVSKPLTTRRAEDGSSGRRGLLTPLQAASVMEEPPPLASLYLPPPRTPMHLVELHPLLAATGSAYSTHINRGDGMGRETHRPPGKLPPLKQSRLLPGSKGVFTDTSPPDSFASASARFQSNDIMIEMARRRAMQSELDFLIKRGHLGGLSVPLPPASMQQLVPLAMPPRPMDGPSADEEAVMETQAQPFTWMVQPPPMDDEYSPP
ncbi:unnamed protein product [Vitrella brassicaformis CCMP3155]|uniref:B box-type domain-containing protein n=4 Tax=Vitrella brassicaformis TaxID=1169539 RepID=A0A0G4G8F8_VITBC|nr:unnamed protein product [Vitrella brassicaformis CCMP3155]|eukprot:CEM25167.1 unnamed protein product [Vitrella brassicaformis CCMP3155]